ncbi:MAG: threonine-phosphate decarboxylase CobD [Verrucomicrobiota bacterium]
MHQHGGHPEFDFERLGIEPREVLDFSVNISPLGIPLPVKENWNNLLADCGHYPSMDGAGVKRFYEKRFGIPPGSVLPGNGSIDLIYDIPRTLNVKRALVPQPSFHDYAHACKAIGAEVITGELDQLEGCDALFVGNPNNPTGKLIPAEVLLQLADNFPETLFFVDEAFIQFIEAPEAFTLMRPERLRNNVIVFHSLTKTYALPGLRLGACISTPETIQRLAESRAPWMVGGIAERAAELLADCSDYEEMLVPMITKERESVFQALEKHSAFNPVPGAANFLLVQWTGSDNLDDLLRQLLEHGLYVRDCRNFETLEENWFRIAIRRPGENTQLIKALLRIATD